jgi:hypothetical protein
MHKYIQDEMDFLDITSFGMAYRYVVKIEQKLKQKMRQFGPGNRSQKNQGNGGPNLQNKGHFKDGKPHENQSKTKENKDIENIKKDTGKWCDFHKSP